MSERPITPWGWPTQYVADTSGWINQYAPWLMIGALLLLGWASKKR